MEERDENGEGRRKDGKETMEAIYMIFVNNIGEQCRFVVWTQFVIDIFVLRMREQQIR